MVTPTYLSRSKRLRWAFAGAWLTLVSLAAQGASGAGFSAARVDLIESCVDASSPIRFASAERRASLEESDAAEVVGSLLARYPAVARIDRDAA